MRLVLAVMKFHHSFEMAIVVDVFAGTHLEQFMQ